MRVYFAGPLFTPYERSFIDECAARLRAEGIEVFVPHENALAAGDTSAATIFEKDWNGLSEANAVVALIDGPTVDHGTACEIGIFYALMQTDSTKKGIVGLLTDLRATSATRATASTSSCSAVSRRGKGLRIDRRGRRGARRVAGLAALPAVLTGTTVVSRPAIASRSAVTVGRPAPLASIAPGPPVAFLSSIAARAPLLHIAY